MALTFVLTVLWSVEVGVAVSVTISLLMVVHRSSRARMSILVSFSHFIIRARAIVAKCSGLYCYQGVVIDSKADGV